MAPPTPPPPPRRPVAAVACVLSACVLSACLLVVGAPSARADLDSARKFFADNVKAPEWKARRSAYGAFQDHDGGPAAAAILAAAG
ncbi:MAG: hypothetical protein JNM10_06155, partial [Planctomycetia bacterium]|nr:hypothetical protein [Planctomycetia bacterium]